MRLTTNPRIAALTALFVSFLAVTPNAPAEEPEVAVVVKIAGIPWFTAMEKGIKEAAKETGLNAYMVGPTTADPAQQVRLVEDLVAKKVKVIAVVPNDAKALEPVFQRAEAAGIPVITHESPDQQDNTWDIEMIDNQQFGELYMQNLAKYMGEEGDYMVVVGGLTVPLHNAWADYAIAYQKGTLSQNAPRGGSIRNRRKPRRNQTRNQQHDPGSPEFKRRADLWQFRSGRRCSSRQGSR